MAVGHGRDPGGGTERGAALDRAAQGFQLLRRLGAVDQLRPARRPRQRPGVEQAGGTAAVPLGQRAVRPVGGGRDQAGAHGVALDVAADGDQMRVVLDQEALVAALVEMALAEGAVAAVAGLGVALGQAADEAGEVAVGVGPQDEMPVVGHQAPGEQPHAGARTLLGQELGEGAVVDLVVEQGCARVGAVQHVVDEAADVGAGGAGHGGG